MKKSLFVAAVAALALVTCKKEEAAATEGAVDSTAVAADSTTVAADSTTVAADSTAVKADSAKVETAAPEAKK